MQRQPLPEPSFRQKAGTRWSGFAGAFALLFSAISALSSPANAKACSMNLRGINLAGAEFGSVGQPYGQGYIYPSKETIEAMGTDRFNSIRLPFLWERLQPTLNQPLDPTELGRIQDVVKTARANKLVVILDVHNYARYNGELIGSAAVPVSAFADFWKRLSAVFANDRDILFGIMNEPHDIAATDWLTAANAAIRSIRDIGAGNLVLVPGTAWTGAHSWTQSFYGPSNASVMTGVVDPSNNFAFEVHQYADSDFSGKADNCSHINDAVSALKDFDNWLQANDAKGFLGEFGTVDSLNCLVGLKQMIDVVDNNPDRWVGWAYWASGDWWPKNAPMIIHPNLRDGGSQILRILEPALGIPAKTCRS